MTRVLGAVLAGGRSRRFGSDKALATLDGVALIDHVVAALAPQVAAVAICGRTHRNLPALADRPPGGEGPLAGINAALAHAAAHRFDGVLSISCDAPRLPDDLVSRLVGPTPAYVEGQPVIGWWPIALAAALEAHLARDRDRSMRGWIAACGARATVFDTPLANVNRPADLDALQGEAR